MSYYVLQPTAVKDLSSIDDFGIEMFGVRRTERYRKSLADSFERLADYPHVGRQASDAHRQYRRFPHWPYIIFYELKSDHIAILRIVHGKADTRIDLAL